MSKKANIVGRTERKGRWVAAATANKQTLWSFIEEACERLAVSRLGAEPGDQPPLPPSETPHQKQP